MRDKQLIKELVESNDNSGYYIKIGDQRVKVDMNAFMPMLENQATLSLLANPKKITKNEDLYDET